VSVQEIGWVLIVAGVLGLVTSVTGLILYLSSLR